MTEGKPLGNRKKEIPGGTTVGGENELSFLRPEVRLLLCCACKEVEPRQKEEMEAYLQSPIDWTFLVKTAQDHGLLLFLYRALWKNFADCVPKHILGLLRTTFLFNLRRNVLLTVELCKLLKLFEKEGIPAIPLKGPVLTVSLYGDLGMRPFSDLDLLFKKKDVPKAKALLVAEGYRIPFSLTPAQKEVFLQGDLEAAMVRTDGRTIVEILWGTPGDFSIVLDFAPFWERLEKKCFEGQVILTLGPEDWVLYLSLHQATHGWNRLLWLSDLDLLIRSQPGMDWDGVMGRAEKFRCRRVTLISLALIQNLLQTPLPEEVQKKIAGDKIALALSKELAGSLLAQGEGSTDSYGQALFLLRVTDGFRDKVHFVLRQALQPNLIDQLVWPLPRKLSALYFLLHPLRMAGNQGKRMITRLCKETSGDPKALRREDLRKQCHGKAGYLSLRSDMSPRE